MFIILITLLSIFSIANCQKEGESCVESYTNTVGVCVQADRCLSAKNNLQYNGIQPTFCEYDAFETAVVCCKDGSNILQVGSPKPADNRPVWNKNDNTKRVSERKCEEYSKRVVDRVDYIPLTLNPEPLSITSSNCKYSGVELIVGGENANQGEFPHMAAIGWANPEGSYSFDCGGSLISSKFILTAGHCTKNSRNGEPVIVRLGDQNIDPTVNDGADPVDVPIRRIHKHPEYNSPIVYNDIALVELVTDVEFNSNVRPACLWTKSDFGGHLKALVTGWGVTNWSTKQTSNELQKLALTLMENDYCDKLLHDARNRKWLDGFRPSQMCAGELRGGKDTCQGDSGSPLQVSSNDNHCLYYVMGVTSFGKDCAKSGLPAIYTRVSSYIDWIENIVWPGE